MRPALPPAPAWVQASALRPAPALLAALALAASCGAAGDVAPAGPLSAQEAPAPAGFGGPGDQAAPAIRGERVAWVDYAGDTNGGCFRAPDDLDCAGVLTVQDLGADAPLLQVPVVRALPTLGEGFVAWTEADADQARYSTQPVGVVRLARLDDGRPEVLTAPGERADVSRPPAVDGDRVAWLTPWGEHAGVRVFDVATGRTDTVTLRSPGQRAGVDLDGGRAAFVDFDDARSTWGLVIHDLGTGTRRWLERVPEIGGEVWEPTLEGDLAAFKQGPRWGCWSDDCAVRVVAERLSDGRRAVLGGEDASRYGPVLIDGDAVLWLDVRDGPYALYGARVTDEAPVRVTPEEAILGWTAPGDADRGRLVWADRSGGDWDVRVTTLR